MKFLTWKRGKCAIQRVIIKHSIFSLRFTSIQPLLRVQLQAGSLLALPITVVTLSGFNLLMVGASDPVFLPLKHMDSRCGLVLQKDIAFFTFSESKLLCWI